MKVNWFRNMGTVKLYLYLLKSEWGRNLIVFIHKKFGKDNVNPLKNEAINILMKREKFRSVEDVEDIHLLALQALDIGASGEAESTTCESVQKAYSL